ncbi:MAG: UDP-N-acetylmuramyl-tripeptide synthetase [Candidatus Paceibacterota bacterium]|jgi:UDP-N-acetylmuramoyl-L-alanyl-D-glutamate--2,6-diaminopimelate ligase
MLDSILHPIRKAVPAPVMNFFRPAYHLSMSFLGALWYRFPSRRIKIVAVTGTKGKTSVTEIVNAILEEAGFKTALSNTIRFKVGDESTDNLYKMSMPGRFFVQRFIARAAKAGCSYVTLEVTSQGAILGRHRFIDFDALIYTNIAPEHIEAHGSFENYVNAKLSIADAVVRSRKRETIIVANADDAHAAKFLGRNFTEKHPYSLADAMPYNIFKHGFDMTVRHKLIKSHLSGEFNIYNELAAITFAETQGVDIEICRLALEKFTGIRGRVEKIDAGQDFDVIVDYAHTPDSLQKLYDVFQKSRRICVLGNTGGGRDVWKRDEMAQIAARSCDEIILTNEDPYDDDPRKIVDDMAQAMPSAHPHVIMDRRAAIAHAISLAKTGDAVLITGKGTDPYIMGANNSKIPWSDAVVAREEIESSIASKS